MTIKYKRLEINEDSKDILLKLTQLSQKWADEKSCPSYDANKEDYFLNRELFVAIDNNEIVAYALGDIKVQKEDTSYNKVDEKGFVLDELYVDTDYRRMGIGQELFKYLEESMKGKADFIGVIATSYKYLDLLHFYIDDLDMNFINAFLTKRIN